MTKTSYYKDSWFTPNGAEELRNYQQFQEQINHLHEVYSEDRVRHWQEEISQLEGFWEQMAQDWEGTMTAMGTVSGQQFAQITDQAVNSGKMVSQSFSEVVSNISEDLDNLALGFVNSLKQAWGSWLGSGELWGGSGSGPFSWVGNIFGGVSDALGWFHQGGVVKAHQGMVVSPSYLAGAGSKLASDEKLIIAQTGEGILPRDSMNRLGKDNFEALRTGQFERMADPKASPLTNYKVQIQVQALDAGSVAAIDWDQVVRRQIVPALRRVEGRRV
ncbi:MAG: hypothetical protein DRG58_04980 [Deltaproteobacteria bacterium]|nr:MAG: hypothetical protein DRG58_04980 [Deltaproteobacteria bacterium]